MGLYFREALDLFTARDFLCVGTGKDDDQHIIIERCKPPQATRAKGFLRVGGSLVLVVVVVVDEREGLHAGWA